MKLKLLSLFFLLSISSAAAQRTLPYPIILVHGWTGSHTVWNEFTNYLQFNVGLSIERNPINFILNCDNNRLTSNLGDVCEWINYIGNHDVYMVNFDNGDQSNQAAAVKQGYAIKLAIARVLAATGAEKVMLLGHSMGGLAIREYLQNPSNWQLNGQHHVAKLATIGTPHRGSNSSFVPLSAFLGKDENSEAVRDLRESYFYASCTRNGQPISCPGVYLWGGGGNKKLADYKRFW